MLTSVTIRLQESVRSDLEKLNLAWQAKFKGFRLPTNQINGICEVNSLDVKANISRVHIKSKQRQICAAF